MRKINSSTAIYAAAVILIGGFFDWCVALLGAALALVIFVRARKSKIVMPSLKSIQLLPMAVVVISAIVTFWSVDRLQNIMGVIRLIALLLWMILCLNTDEADRKNTIATIPAIGAAMVAVSIVAYTMAGLRPYFWENSRLSGIFQYANTAALFWAVGVIVLLQNIRKKWQWYVQLFLLLIGILLTGSRSVLLILTIWAIYKSISDRKLRRPILIVIGLLLAVSGIIFAITGSTANISRVFAGSSTIWGRLLYYRDGLDMLLHNPQGLGYMGYLYSQGLYATGVYSVRYVHNDLLQVGIDYGMAAMLLVVVYLVWQFAKGRQDAWKKEILAVIIAACLVDFSAQYLSITFVAVLCMDLESGTVDSNSKLTNVGMVLLMALFSYLIIATATAKYGNPRTSIAMLPGNVSSRMQIISHTNDANCAYELSSEVIKINPRVRDAYVFRAYVDTMQRDIDALKSDMDMAIMLAPYDVSVYQVYESLLMDVGADASQLARLHDRLAAMEDRTSRLAYRISDKPVFEW